MATHYVNNTDFLAALKEYKASVRDAEKHGNAKPQISNYIGECIIKIATHLSYKPNFINYTYRDEMISDGIENCMMYIDNFDPDKYSNPFAYFTQIIYYAFIRRIQKEKKQTLIKGKIIIDMPFDQFEVQQHDDGSYSNSYLDFVQSNGIYDDIIAKDDIRKAKARAKRQQASLDDIIESSQDNDYDY